MLTDVHSHSGSAFHSTSLGIRLVLAARELLAVCVLCALIILA